MLTDFSCWRQHPIANQKEIRLEWENLCLRIIKRDCDLLLIEDRNPREDCIRPEIDPDTNRHGEIDANADHADHADHRRYAFENPVDFIRVEPCTLDRPLVVQPLNPLRLAPKAKVDFFVSIPLDIQLSTGNQEALVNLERIRGELISDTWFGDSISGVLCYAIKSRARRECPSINSEQTLRAICKIQMHNRSTEQLHCERFCLRLDHCHLWQSGRTLWTSPVGVRYNGSSQLSTIDYSTDAPPEAKGAVKIAEAVEEPLKGLIRRTFAGLSNSLT